MSRLPRCIWPSCKRIGVPTRLPITGEHVSLCHVHQGARFLGHMRDLVAHG